MTYARTRSTASITGGGRLALDGEQLVLNGHPTEYVRKARREAERVREFLRPALVEVGSSELAGRVPVRPVIAIVGGLLRIDRCAPGVTVVTNRHLVHVLRALPAALDEADVASGAARSSPWAMSATP